MPEKLEQVANAVRTLRSETKRIRIEADAWAEQQIREHRNTVERIVLEALAEGYSVTDVAEAYTISGKTPNRNAIHQIKNSVQNLPKVPDKKLPFEWARRNIGRRTVYDVVGLLFEFGPEGLTGDFVWRYDNGELDPVITEEDPYPNSKYYREILNTWLEDNPYPKEV